MSWKFPGYEINEAINWDQLEADYDWFRDMRDVPQDPVWHAEGDVFIHTRMVVEELIALPEFQVLSEEEKHIMVTAALLHDVEKRSTTEIEVIDGEERIVSPKHAKKGEYTTRALLYRDIPTPFLVREQIAKLVRLHGLPLWAISKEDPRKAVIEASLVVDTKLLAMIAKADVLGRICEDQEDLLFKIALFEELCRENDCFGQAKNFASDYGRFLYLSRPDIAPDYHPYEDLKFNVIMMCAFPGAGKDTYIQEHFDLPVLSLDDFRRANKISPTDKKGNSQVIQMGREKAREFMRVKQSFVFNATNITTSIRRQWANLICRIWRKSENCLFRSALQTAHAAKPQQRLCSP